MNKQQLIAALEDLQTYQLFDDANAPKLIERQEAISLVNQLSEPAGWQPVPDFFKQIVRKLEFSANQCELWEEPEDASIVACEYRSLSDKLKSWMEKHGK